MDKKLFFVIGIEGSGHYMLRDVIKNSLTNEVNLDSTLIYDLKSSHPKLCNFLHYLKTPNHVENKESYYRYADFYSYEDGLSEFKNILSKYDSFYIDYSFPFNMDTTRFFDYPSLSSIHKFISNLENIKLEVIFLNRNLAEACKSTVRRGHARDNQIVGAYTVHFSYLEVLNNKYFAKKRGLNYLNLDFEKMVKRDADEFQKLEELLSISITNSDLDKIREPNIYDDSFEVVDKFFSENMYPNIE
jgi:hypothetical protein